MLSPFVTIVTPSGSARPSIRFSNDVSADSLFDTSSEINASSESSPDSFWDILVSNEFSAYSALDVSLEIFEFAEHSP